MAIKVVHALILASLLVACGQKTEAPAPEPTPTAALAPPPQPEEDPRIEEAKRAVLGALKKDPGNAQFQDVAGGEVNGNFSVCGKVNAKNATGGYVGFKQFCWTEKTGLMPFSVE